jgi:hypothetical protein
MKTLHEFRIDLLLLKELVGGGLRHTSVNSKKRHLMQIGLPELGEQGRKARAKGRISASPQRRAVSPLENLRSEIFE